MNRADFEQRDASDPVGHMRARFVMPEDVIYLDGNSLGALPKGVRERVDEVISAQWSQDLIRSWTKHGWIDLPRRVGNRIAALIGADPDTVVCGDTTSVNLYKAIGAALEMTGGQRILTDSSNFPTDVYVMSGLGEVTIVEPDAVIESIDASFDVIALTEIDYRTGRRHDMETITRAAHSVGALMVWDLAHSAGAFPVDLAGCGVDLAVGCGYKYLNGGPGAPAFLYVAPRHHEAFANPIRGWFGHAAPFDFRLDWEPVAGIDRAQVGTPHVLSMAALDAALDVFDEVELSDLRAKSVELTEGFIALVEKLVPEVELASPRDADLRGSQVSVRHPHGYAVMQALIERGVIGDFRAPDVMRFGFAPLYVRHVDVFDAVTHLREVLDEDAWQEPRFSRPSAVT